MCSDTTLTFLCWHWLTVLSCGLYLDLQRSSKGHLEGTLDIFGENSLEGLFKQRCVEGVRHHHVTSGEIRKCQNILSRAKHEGPLWILSLLKDRWWNRGGLRDVYRNTGNNYSIIFNNSWPRFSQTRTMKSVAAVSVHLHSDTFSCVDINSACLLVCPC